MGKEFSRVRELCAALGTDLGVILLASITWGEDKESLGGGVGWGVPKRLCTCSPGTLSCVWGNEPTVRPSTRLRVSPATRDTPAWGCQGVHTPLPSSPTPPSRLSPFPHPRRASPFPGPQVTARKSREPSILSRPGSPRPLARPQSGPTAPPPPISAGSPQGPPRREFLPAS